MRVVSAHMHHRPSVRERQWRRLQQYLQGQPDIPTLLLMDHNNILTPGVDSQFVRGEEVSGVHSARGAEVDALRTLAVVDAWELVHAGTTAPPPPYTYGHTIQGPKRNLRRIDRVHVPEAMTPSVAGGVYGANGVGPQRSGDTASATNSGGGTPEAEISRGHASR